MAHPQKFTKKNQVGTHDVDVNATAGLCNGKPTYESGDSHTDLLQRHIEKVGQTSSSVSKGSQARTDNKMIGRATQHIRNYFVKST
jgi:hypothetical protein